MPLRKHTHTPFHFVLLFLLCVLCYKHFCGIPGALLWSFSTFLLSVIVIWTFNHEYCLFFLTCHSASEIFTIALSRNHFYFPFVVKNRKKPQSKQWYFLRLLLNKWERKSSLSQVREARAAHYQEQTWKYRRFSFSYLNFIFLVRALLLNLEMPGLPFSLASKIDIGVSNVLTIVFSTPGRIKIIWRLLVKFNEHSWKPLSVATTL